MDSEERSRLGNLEKDIREALANWSPSPTPECPDMDGLLDLIERVDAGEHPEAMTHVSTCARCRRQYIGFRASIATADSLRAEASGGGESNLTTPEPPTRPERNRDRVVLPFLHFMAVPLRFAAIGAASGLIGLLGYSIGSRNLPPTSVPVRVTSAPDASLQRSLDDRGAEVQRLTSENAELRRKVASGNPPRAESEGTHTGNLKATRLPQSRPGRSGNRLDPVVAPVVRSVASFAYASFSRANLSGLEVRGVNGDGTVDFQPTRTWLITDQPRFRCRFPNATSDTHYRVRLTGPSGDIITFEQTGPALDWRPSYRLPRGSKVAWTVDASNRDNEYTASGEFGVLTEDEVQRVRQSVEKLQGLSRARYYRKAGLLIEAQTILKRIPDTSPDYADAIRELAQIADELTPREAQFPEIVEEDQGM